MTNQTSDNKFGVSEWIVDPVVGLGTHTTISAALGDASSGETIFIRPGVYTEDLTLKAGVNLVGFSGNAFNNIVNITGKLSASFDGSCSLGNLTLTTNSDFCLEITGANDTQVNIETCNIIALDNTAINFASSGSSSLLELFNSIGDIATTGISFFQMSAAGTFNFVFSDIGNTGGSSTPSTASAGSLFMNWSQYLFPVTTSGTNAFGANWSSFFPGGNTTCFTIGGSGSQIFSFCNFTSNTASAISVSTSCTLQHCLLNSTNANIVSGTGTVTYGDLLRQSGSTGVINATGGITGQLTNSGSISFDGGTNVLDYYESGSWTPAIEFGGGTTGITYTTQTGSYTRIGKFVHAQCEILLSSKGTDTGAATITGLPFTASGDSVGTATWGTIDLDVAGNYYYVSANLADSAQVLTLQENGDNVAIAALTDADFSNTSSITVSIQYMVA